MNAFLTLTEADTEITRLKARIATLEDEALRDHEEIGRLRAAARTARTVAPEHREAVRQAVATFHAQMDEHEATARALGIVP